MIKMEKLYKLVKDEFKPVYHFEVNGASTIHDYYQIEALKHMIEFEEARWFDKWLHRFKIIRLYTEEEVKIMIDNGKE